jgi:hypothetical protein
VVAIDGSKSAGVKKASSPYESDAIGVVSTAPGEILSAADGTGMPVLVALAGRIPIKVSTINGSIEPGDYLTASSIPGVAMKATGPGEVVAKAMSSYDNPDPNVIGTVVSFANLSWQNPGGPLQGSDILTNLSVSGDTTLSALTVTGAATFQSNIVVSGHIITDGMTPSAETLQAAGTDNSGANSSTCNVNGNDTSGTITLLTGTVNVTDGAECTISFATPYTRVPRAILAASSQNSASVQAYVTATTTDMSLNFSVAPQPHTTYQFNYWNPQ